MLVVWCCTYTIHAFVVLYRASTYHIQYLVQYKSSHDDVVASSRWIHFLSIIKQTCTTMSTSTFPPPSSMPPPFNDRLLYAYYLNLAKAEKGDILKHQLYVKWECQVLQDPKKAPKQWGVTVKGKGLIDYYDTREEATKRAFW